ncbi:MAG TPA: type II pantothenate kinase [Bacillota bacterium]|nr:type II pantothenate kinase [Bacillota bacterium]HPE38427.1 type II pantothenate kinase [Bacillota bacterium]
MSIVVGLDVGGSTTKVVGMKQREIVGTEIVKADDPVTSAFGALGKFIDTNHLSISDISELMITGVGASFPNGDLLGIKTTHVQEFLATGLGGLFLSGLDHAVVVSMGTGTAFVEAKKYKVRHIIGSGVGGGTLIGLANSSLNIRDFELITEIASHGNLSHVDLTISDISKVEIPGLPMETTASNFGKMQDDASRSDIALGLFNLVFQSVGTMAVLSARTLGLHDVVFTGQATRVPQCKSLFEAFSHLYNINFVVPELSEYATAIGSAIYTEEF